MSQIEEKQELLALMQYLVKHNREHTAELAELANKLTDNEKSHRLLTQAIDEYTTANRTLEAALNECKED